MADSIAAVQLSARPITSLGTGGFAANFRRVAALFRNCRESSQEYDGDGN
jgi:hypothetical protein